MAIKFEYPSVFIERVVLNNAADDEKLNCDLLLALKAPLGSTTISTLSNNFLTIKVLEVRDEKLSSFLDMSSEIVKKIIESPTTFVLDDFFINLATKMGIVDEKAEQDYVLRESHISKIAKSGTRQFGPSPSSEISNNISISSISAKSRMFQFRKFFAENCKVHIIRNEDIKSKDSVNRIYSDSRGQSVLNVYIKKKLLGVENTGHLSLYTYSSYDRNAIQESINLPIKEEDLEQNVKVSAELVLNKNRIASETFAYFLEDDSVWTGDVHYDSGVWFTGKFSERNQINSDGELEKRSVQKRSFYNTKIQDFRTIKAVQQRIAFQQDDVRILSDFQIVNENSLIKQKDSPIKIINNDSDRVIITCSIEDLLFNHSPAYRSLQKINIDIKNWASTIKVRVYKKRVREYLPDSVVMAESDFLPDFSNNQEKIYVRNIKRQIADSSLRIIVSDPELFSTTGTYCYGVELYFTDPVIPYLLSMITKAEKQQKVLLDYYQKCKLLGYTDISGEEYEGNYDPELNIFTEKFINSVKEEDLLDVCKTFLDCWKMVANLSNINLFWYFSTIQTMVSPKTGTPEGVEMFVKLYGTILDQIIKIYESCKNNSLMMEQKYFNKRDDKRVAFRRSTKVVAPGIEKASITKRKINHPTIGAAASVSIGRSVGKIANVPEAKEKDSLLKDIQDLSDLCSLTVKKDSSYILNVTIEPPNRKITDISILGTKITDLLGGLKILKPMKDVSSNIISMPSRGLIGSNIISDLPMVLPTVDFGKSIRGLLRDAEEEKETFIKPIAIPALNLKDKTREIRTLSGEVKVEKRIKTKMVAFDPTEEIKNNFAGLKAAPVGISSKIVMNNKMGDVVKQKTVQKNKIKKAKKRLGR